MRIAILQFSHETVTFLESDTTIEDFTYPGSPASGEALLESQPRSYIGGFVKVVREFDGVELVGIESPLSSRRGTASGWITEETFDHFLGKMTAELEALGRFHGVYLALHGAMGVRGVPRPEAEIARRVRSSVGPDAVIVGTFDPHGNEDETFLEHADVAFAVKFYPHYDSYLQGERAARTLVRAIRGDYKPASATIKGADPHADGDAVDRHRPLDGPGAARTDVGGTRTGRLRQCVLRIPLVGRARRGDDGPGHGK